MSPKIAILVRRNYWQTGAAPGNTNSHRSVPDIMAAILQAGGMPHLVFQGSTATPGDFDGLVLPGGGDIDPLFYGQTPSSSVDVDAELDEFQLTWTRAALALRQPLLGICRGMQLLNVAAGGSLVQDVAGEHLPVEVLARPGLRARVVHPIHIKDGSRLQQLWGLAELGVNSIHHQAVERLGEGLEAVAWAPDGIVEAVEVSESPWQRGVQFHPEDMRREAPFQALFSQLVRDARA